MLANLIQSALKLRYNITVSGLDSIKSTESTLILPNHPAEIDPVIITSMLWESLHPRPVVLETMYHLPVIKWVMQRIRAIPIADMDFASGPYKRRRIQRTLEQIANLLNKGDNILMYPSGRLTVTGHERLGAASGVQSILSQAPQINIAVVKIRGLYGSIFSKATTGGITPDVFSTFREAAKILLQNLIFFCPKREITIEVSYNPADFPRYGDALSINKYLESIYNAPTPEAASLVSHSFFRERFPVLPSCPIADDSWEEIDEQVANKVYDYVAHVARIDRSQLNPSTLLGEELGIDSLTMAEILVWLDREFEAHDVELAEITSIGSLLRFASGQYTHRPPRTSYQPPAKWTNSAKERPHPELRSATTLSEAFLITCARHGDLPAMGDERSGMLTWQQLKAKAVFLARFIRRLPNEKIGILLPASVSSSVTTIATILAGKIPVFLNWTAGRRSLLHACETTGLTEILTSETFLDSVPSDLEFLESKFIMLEDIRDKASLREKIASHRLSQESLSQILSAFGVQNQNPAETAVILFTSGSEALPKGVPLSHGNLIANIRGVLDAVAISNEDVLLGFLPPFHSFGLTVCSLLPLVTGLRVAYHPNPNESRKIGKAVATWGCSVVAGTPTFLQAVLKSGPPEQYTSLRALVSGAERAPQSLFELADAINPEIAVLEGYGITECSPVVSVGRPGEPHVGVGRPILDTILTIVHPETFEPCSDGAQGLVLIQGPGVFDGYLDPSINPYVEYNNTTWYNSGDLGYLKDGSLVITGRLKRFIKIAGEMISLSAIEDTLQQHLYSPDGGPTVAILSKGSEGDSRPKLIAIIAGTMTLETAQQRLKETGFPPLVHLTDVHHVTSLPLLGSGKVDYQSLKIEYNC